MLKVYAYAKCDTCRKAIKFLNGENVSFEEVPIREMPPSKAELKAMLAARGGDLRKLFNTSGRDYKELGMSARLPDMTEAQALELLAGNGNLVKRPFVIGDGIFLLGFKEDAWRAALG